MLHRASVGRRAGSFGVRPCVVVALLVALAVPSVGWAAPASTLRAGSPRQTAVAAGLEDALRFNDPVLQDTYDALQQVLQPSLGLTSAAVDELIRQQAEHLRLSVPQLLRGVLDVPDAEMPQDGEFDEILRKSEALFESGGNGGRGFREIARAVDVQAVSDVTGDDSGGNYGDWRTFLERQFGRFVPSLGGDVANARTVETSLVTRQVMADRLRERPEGGWESKVTLRQLLLEEITQAIRAFRTQYPNLAVTDDQWFIRSLATVISAHRIVSQAFPDLLATEVFSKKASGQNLLGVAIAVRSGFLDPSTRQVHPARLKRATLLWNRALGLDGRSGLVIPGSLDGVHLYFVYADRLDLQRVEVPGMPRRAMIQFGESNIPLGHVFTVSQPDDQPVLTDGFGRPLRYEPSERAYVARGPGGVVQNRFEEFPDKVAQAIRDRLRVVPAVSIVRGEFYTSEEESWYEGTRVLVWGAEFPAGRAPSVSPPIAELHKAILTGNAAVRTIAIGIGSEGTSTDPHFWRPERVRFLAELARRRKAGQPVPRVVFIFNPAETNDSYNLGPLGIIRNYELTFRQALNDDTVRFEDLVPEVALYDHTSPWVLAPNLNVAEEMGVSLDRVDYLHLLGPVTADEHYGLVRKNRRPMPLDVSIRAQLEQRFGRENVHVGPYADVRGTVESSRGRVVREARVMALTHRLGIVLFPERRDALLPLAIREERRIFREKFQRPPTDEELAAFLNQVGYHTAAQEIQAISAGLEEWPSPTLGSWQETPPEFLA